MLVILFYSLQDVEDVLGPQFKDEIYNISSGNAAQESEAIRANDSLATILDEREYTLLSMIAFFCVNRSSLNEFYLKMLLEDSTRELSKLKAIDSIRETEKGPENTYVIGDLHGSIDSVFSIFANYTVYKATRKVEFNSFIDGLFNNSARMVFLGDYVDRGGYGNQVLQFILALRQLLPQSVYLVRGNHEQERLNAKYGFKEYFLQSYSEKLYRDELLPLYEELPLGYVFRMRTNGTQYNVFFCHGGAPVVNVLNSSIEDLARKHEFGPVEYQILWNDPQKSDRVDVSRRRIGYQYGESSFAAFCQKYNISALFRGHQFFRRLRSDFKSGNHFTVFSAQNYTGQRNTGFIALLDQQGQVRELQLQYVPDALDQS